MIWVNPQNANDRRTVTTSTNYDGDDRPYQTLDEFGHTSQMIYDVNGRVTQAIDNLGNATGTVYDRSGNVLQTINPDGTVSETYYDSLGRVSYSDDAHVPGQADVRGTHTVYDNDGRVIQTQRLDGIVITVTTQNGISTSQLSTPGTVLSSTSSVYNDLGQVVSNTDEANQTTTYGYDNAGRQISMTDALNETTYSAYDAGGRQISSTDALGHTTQSVFNADGQIVKTIYPDESFSSVGYDNNGRKVSATDQMGNTTNYGYDALGRLTIVTLPAVLNPANNQMTRPVTVYGYDQYGDMTSVTDANSHVTSYTFDQFGHQLTRTLPMGQSETNTYDSYGRLATRTDFKGQQEVFHYDSLGRNDTQTYYAAGSQTAGETMTFHFDGLGRQDQVTDVVGSSTRVTQYGYDLENRVTSITSPEGTVNYRFDPTTGYHTETFTANTDTAYGYDQLGRLSTVTVKEQNGVILTTPLVTTYYYTPVSNIDHISYPTGTQTAYGYDVDDRMTSVTNTKGSQLLSSYVYTLNADGLRTGDTEQELEADSTYSTVTHTWAYDAIQRLTQEAVTTTGSVAYTGYTDVYSFDLVGNRLTKNHTQTGQNVNVTYVYNADDEVTTESSSTTGQTYSTAYGYDANGSEISVARTGTGPETDSYTFDLRNQLSGATINRIESSQSVAIVATYTYNANGIRVGSVVTTTIGNASPTTTTTAYLIDSTNPTTYAQILEEHVNGATLPLISYLLGMSVLSQVTSTGSAGLVLPDGHGSTRQLLDSAGNVLIRVAYDAYGAVLGQGFGVINPPGTKILYTNQLCDPALQQYYLRARVYSPATGRFLSRDSITGNLESPITLHTYLYGNDNPLLHIDPSGHGDGLAMESLSGLTAISIGLALAGGAYLYTYALWSIRAKSAATTTNAILAFITSGNTLAVTLGLKVAANSAELLAAIARAIASAAVSVALRVQLPQFQVFPILRSLGPTIYGFDTAALAFDPSWYVLTYLGPNSPIAVKHRLTVWATWGCLMVLPVPPGWQLDEFPYASTVEGGSPPALATPVPRWENATQGALLGAFYRFGLKGKPLSPFLVVPVPI